MRYTSEQYETFWLSELGKVARSGSDQLRASCPIHGGDAPDTLVINLRSGHAFCHKCNETWSMVDFAMLRHGFTTREAASEHVRDIIGGSNGNSEPGTAWPFPFGRPRSITTNDRSLGYLAQEIEKYERKLDDKPTNVTPGWKACELYCYPEARSVKLRYKHKDNIGEKQLSWFALTKKGGWTFPSKLGLELPLYRAANLVGAKEIWLLNGEKAVDRAVEAWGIVATNLPGGEKQWRPAFLTYFLEATVYLVMDNDETGTYYGKLNGSYLAKAGVEIHLITLPDLPPKGDLWDYIEAGGTLEACRQIAARAPLASPEAPPKKKASRVVPITINPDFKLDGNEVDLLRHEFNDTGNARRLFLLKGAVLRYASDLERPWRHFNQTHWQAGDENVAIPAAQETLHTLQEQARKLDSGTADNIWKFGNNKLNAGGIHAMLDLARPLLHIQPNEFDRHPFLVNCTNGTFDLESGELRPHRPEDFLTRCFPYAYDPTLPEPEVYLRSLDEWFGGGPDASIADLEHAELMSQYVRRLAGGLLLGHTRYKYFLLVYGEGNNGKTTFITIQQAVLGPYAVTISPTTITKGWGRNQNNVDAAVARTSGARAAFIAEPSESHFDQGQLKRLTQGDVPIEAVFKGKNPFEFLPTATPVIEVNEPPLFTNASDKAFTDRMHLLHFSRIFPISVGKTQRELLMPELPQIFNMQLKDAQRVIRDGLNRPLDDARNQLRAIRDMQARENDGLEPFVEDCLNIGSGKREHIKNIDALAYRPWCERNHQRPKASSWLSKQLCERDGIRRGHDPTNHKGGWLDGVEIKPEIKRVAVSGRAPTWEKPTDD